MNQALRPPLEAARFGALAVLAWLTGCEPCAVVLGGHCVGGQHDEDFDATKPEPGEQILEPPAPLMVPHTRG